MSHAGPSHGPPDAGGGPLARAASQLGLIATLGYFLLAVVGLVYESTLLGLLRVSFLQFAEPEDFLMAGIRHPVVLSFTLASALLLLLVLALGRVSARMFPALAEWERRVDRGGWRWFNRFVVYPSFIVIYFLLFVVLYAKREWREIRAGDKPPVRAELIAPTLAGARAVDGALVASTGEYLFLFAGADSSVRIVPVRNVAEILRARRLGGEGPWRFPDGSGPTAAPATAVVPPAPDSTAVGAGR